MFLINATWRAGSKHTVVDVLSRYPVNPASSEETVDLDLDPAQVFSLTLCDDDTSERFISDQTIVGIQEAAQSCLTYRKLINHISSGFPEKSKLGEDLKPFWRMRHELTVLGGLVFWGYRIIVPSQLRRHILELLHASHQGHQRTLRRARQAVFWPGISNDIKNIVSTCQLCQSFLPSCPQEPLLQVPMPTYPFQKVGTDLFSYAGYEYLVAIDRFTGWIMVCKVGHSATTSNIIQILQQFMTDTGIPEILRSDNGPQFSSFQFKEWTARWGMHHSSSPHYPQSNGLAESAVKTIKHLLAKTAPNGDVNSEAFRMGLLELRNTPREDGRSPAQMLFGHPIRTLLPLHRSKFSNEWNQRRQQCDEKAIRLRERAKEKYDSKAHPLKKLLIGDTVLIQDHVTKRWNLVGEIIELVNDRSYLLRTETGRVLRRFLRHFHPSSQEETPSHISSEPRTLRRSPRNHPSPDGQATYPKRGVDTGRSSLSRNSNKVESIEYPKPGARLDKTEAGLLESG